MSNLIDITHTVKASAAPSEGARYMFDPVTEERYWVTDDPVEPEGEEVPPPPSEVPDAAELGLPVPDPEVPPVPMPTLPKSKKAK